MSSSIAAVSYASSIVVAISTIPSILRLAKRRRVKPANDGKLYEDADGAATEESMAKFSTNWYYLSTLALAIIGLATSLALVIYSTVQMHSRSLDASARSLPQIWLLFISWVSRKFTIDVIC
jgi:hypothetical protein